MAPAKLGLWATIAALLTLGVSLPPSGERTGSETYRQLLPSTVLIVTPTKSKGAGWLLDKSKRLVVTNFHVVGDNDSVDVIFPSFRDKALIAERSYYVQNRESLEKEGRLVRGRVLHKEQTCDLALIELSSLPDDAQAIPLAADSPRPGERVFSLGHRGDLEVLWTCTSGTVRQVLRTQEGYFWRGWHLTKGTKVIVTQSPINEGDSGGPLVNEQGELVGVLAAVQWQTPLATVAIDVTELRAFLSRAKHEAPRRDPEKPAGKQGTYDQVVRSVGWVKSSASSPRATGWLLDRDHKLFVTTATAVGSQNTMEVIFPVFQKDRVVAEYNFYRDNPRLLKQKNHLVHARLLTRDVRRNLALLELDGLPEGVAEVSLAEQGSLPGERVLSIGNPNGIEALWIYTAGIVRQRSHANLALPEEKPDPAVVLIQFPGSSNDSGGPVFNEEGNLVGVVSGKESPQQLVGYCLDIVEVKAFVNEHRPRWDPRTLADHQQRIAFLIRTGQYDRALTACDTARKLDPVSPIVLCERARVHCLKGDAEKAVADCNEALKLDPRLPAAYHHRAAAYNLKVDPDRAITDCNAALKLDPKSAAAFAQRGNAYRLKNDLDRALADCDEALWLDQRQTEALGYRGLVLLAKNDLEKALPDLSRAIDLDPYFVLAHRSRGDVHRIKNDPDKAIVDYTQAIELAPRDAFAHHGRGLALAMKDRHENAIADFTRALQINARFASAFSGRGTSQIRKGDLDRALADYTQALQLQPQLASDILKDVQTRAAELGAGERADVERGNDLCCRALQMLEPRAELQKMIKDGLAAAEKESDLRERAQILRATLRSVRERLP